MPTAGAEGATLMQTPRELAAWLWQQHRERAPFQSIKSLLPSAHLEGAYAVQDEFVRLMAASEGEPIGYKIGLSSLRMQQMCGLDQPVVGRILERRVHRGAARVDLGNFGRLGVESELCVILKQDLPLRTDPYTREEIAEAIGGVAAAFELIDDRGADYSRLDALSLIADNSWNAGVVQGGCSAPVDLGALAGALHVDGELVDSGNSRDALSHPLAVVQWLSDHLRGYGSYLRAGELVMTGSIVPTRFAKARSDNVRRLAGLPPAELWVN